MNELKKLVLIRCFYCRVISFEKKIKRNWYKKGVKISKGYKWNKVGVEKEICGVETIFYKILMGKVICEV